MFFKTLVLEIEKRNKRLNENLESEPSIFILNYAPGPLDTEMQKSVREDKNCDKEICAYYTKLFEEGNLLKPLDSAIKLVRILENKTAHKSGAHIDYYDEQ